MEQSKKHWFKFFPAAWLSDPALRRCSPAARGIWIDLICLMHEAEPYGHLLIAGEKLTEKELAKHLQVGLKGYLAALLELTSRNVLSVTEDGVFYSRRMVRDHEKTLQDKANGQLGGLKSHAVGGRPLPPPPASTIEDRGKRLEVTTKEEAPPTPAKRGARTKLPADFTLTEARKQIARGELMPEEQIAHHFGEFCDYWRSDGRSKADWDGVWRQRCVKIEEERRKRQQPRPRAIPPGFAKKVVTWVETWFDPDTGNAHTGIPEWIIEEDADGNRTPRKNFGCPKWSEGRA